MSLTNSGARIGRPPKYSPQLAEEFLTRVERGDRIKVICADPDMPAWRTVQLWIRKNTAFAARYTRIREASAESLEHEAIAESYEATDRDSAAAARVRIDTLKWAAGKRNPRMYADKLLHTGADGESPVAVKLSLDYSALEPHEMLEFRRMLDKMERAAKSKQEPLMIEAQVEESEDADVE